MLYPDELKVLLLFFSLQYTVNCLLRGAAPRPWPTPGVPPGSSGSGFWVSSLGMLELRLTKQGMATTMGYLEKNENVLIVAFPMNWRFGFSHMW